MLYIGAATKMAEKFNLPCNTEFRHKSCK